MINQAYQGIDNLSAIRKQLEQRSFKSATLTNFLTSERCTSLKREILQLQYKKQHDPLHMQYQSATSPPMIEELVANEAFHRVVEELFQCRIIKMRNAKVIKATWKDYSILHDDYQHQGGLDVVMDMTDEWDNSWGGNFFYVDNEGTQYQIPAKYGAVTLIAHQEVQRYLKYINHYGKDHFRYIVIVNLRVERLNSS